MQSLPFLPIIVFLFGLAVGSFLNVVIYRLPRGKSLIHPGSTCPSCGKPIRFYDNIPVISFLVLRRRCRRCGEKISWRYPLVELLTAILFTLVALKYGFSLQSFGYILLTAMLIAITFIDLEHFIIPDYIGLHVNMSPTCTSRVLSGVTPALSAVFTDPDSGTIQFSGKNYFLTVISGYGNAGNVNRCFAGQVKQRDSV